MNLKIKSYKVGEVVCIDNFLAINLTPNYLEQLRNLEVISATQETVEIVFELNATPIVFVKNHTEQKISITYQDKNYDSLANFFQQELNISFSINEWMGNFIDSDAQGFADQASFVEFVNKLSQTENLVLKEANNAVLTSLDQLAGQAPEEAKQQLAQLKDLTIKIQEADQKIDVFNNYQNIMNLNKSKRESIALEKERLVQVVSGSKDLIESKTKLQNEIQVMLAGENVTSLKEKATQVKQNRLLKLFNYLKDTRAFHAYDEEEKERNMKIPKTYILLLLTQTLASVVIFFFTGSLSAFIYLVLGYVVIVASGIVFQIQGYDQINVDKDFTELPSSTKKFSLQNDSREEKDLIKNAWVDALEKDLIAVDSSLSARLGDTTYEGLQARLTQLETESSQIDSKLKQLETEKMDQDDYYKFRREYDIFTIERENLLENLKGKMDNAALETIKYTISKVDEAKREGEKPKLKLPFIIFNLKEKTQWIKDISVQDNQILFVE